MKYFKGFDKDLKCRDFQYELGGTYKTDKAKLCEEGFHACENPLDVFGYYPPSDSRYCTVDLKYVSKKRANDDSKVVGKKITVNTEIGLNGLIEAGVKFIMDKADFKNAKESNTGFQSAATNTGNRSAATNTGDYSAATVEGRDSVAIATGYESKARASLGSAIVVVERGEWNGKTYPIINIKAAIIDGEILKPNTFYTLKNNELVEVE